MAIELVQRDSATLESTIGKSSRNSAPSYNAAES